MSGPNRFLQMLFFALVVRPLTLLVLGLNVRRPEGLPARGPAVIAANHNSHLDTLVLMSLYRLRDLHRLRPVAAADYFLRSRPLAWLSTRVIGVVPIDRRRRGEGDDPLAPLGAALEAGAILILFPEGSRGEPERMSELKGGIGRLVERYPEVAVTPVFLHGLGKSLPRGEALLVPFFCDAFVGAPLRWEGSHPAFMQALRERFTALAAEGGFRPWE